MVKRRNKVYYPPYQITEDLYTTGSEYMTLDYNEYAGPYHTYADGAVYTGAIYVKVKSQPLISYKEYQSDGHKKYDQLTDRKFHKVEHYDYYKPEPTEDDFILGYFNRYFAKKINDLRVFEISEDSYDKILANNTTSARLYTAIKIAWKLTGPKNDVTIGTFTTVSGIEDTNKRMVKLYNEKFLGLSKHVTNFVEFTEY